MADHPESTPETEEPLSDPEKLAKELEAAQKKAAEYYDQLLRLRAEFENFRKRAEREKTESRAWGKQEVILPLIKTLRRSTPLGISVCLGTLTPELYLELQKAGATIYIMKFECANDARYTKVMAPGRLKERLEHIRLLAATGWKVSSGFIAGLPGQQPDELAAALELARTLPLDGCSVSPFIPGESTPLSAGPPSNPDWTFNCMAALRLMRPQWVIPAVSALNLAEKNGYQRGLRAGANLTTINLTPDDVRGDYVIYKRNRFIMTETRVLEAIANEGLVPSRRSLADHYRQLDRRAETAAAVPT